MTGECELQRIWMEVTVS